MVRYRKNNEIVYCYENATNDLWDEVWNKNSNWVYDITPKASKNSRAVALITKFAKTGSKILEAGCGMGQYVYRLNSMGYECIGIDYAEKTINKLNEVYPELDIRKMDVFNLSAFEKNYFDVYYSGGLIEHFWNGYDEIINEADRVIKPRGLLILTFPYMSRCRKKQLKSLTDLKLKEPENFYQFALDSDHVISKLKAKGYKVLHKKGRNGLKGFIEAYPSVKFVSTIYNYSGNLKIAKIFRYVISDILAKLGFGHTVEIVLNKS